MSKFETNKVDVRGDGKVILYQRADVTSSPKWNCRISVTGSTGYKRFSTKTIYYFRENTTTAVK